MCLALQRIAVRAHRQVRQGDLILAVGREAVFELHAAPRAQRWRVVWILVGVDRVLHAGHARIGIAHRDLSDVPRRGHVLIEERGRYAQGVRDVVEAFHLDVLRQNVLRVHVHAHQGLHRRGVLGAVQALDRHIAGLRTLGVGVERVLHPGDERLDILLRRLRTARRRHLIPAQLAQRLLPDLSVVRRGLKVQSFQRKTTHLCAGAVAGDAVRLHHLLMSIRGGLRSDLPGALVSKHTGDAIRTRSALKEMKCFIDRAFLITERRRPGDRQLPDGLSGEGRETGRGPGSLALRVPAPHRG